jgi:hypothetical protein
METIHTENNSDVCLLHNNKLTSKGLFSYKNCQWIFGIVTYSAKTSATSLVRQSQPLVEGQHRATVTECRPTSSRLNGGGIFSRTSKQRNILQCHGEQSFGYCISEVPTPATNTQLYS